MADISRTAVGLSSSTENRTDPVATASPRRRDPVVYFESSRETGNGMYAVRRDGGGGGGGRAASENVPSCFRDNIVSTEAN